MDEKEIQELEEGRAKALKETPMLDAWGNDPNAEEEPEPRKAEKAEKKAAKAEKADEKHE